jgi:hypothetical protein
MDVLTRAREEAIEAKEEKNWRREGKTAIGKNWIEFLTRIALFFFSVNSQSLRMSHYYWPCGLSKSLREKKEPVDKLGHTRAIGTV